MPKLLRRNSNPAGVMTLAAHLKEARRRLLWSLLGVSLAAIGGWFLYEPVLALITQPLREMPGQSVQLNFQTVGAAFDLKLKVCLWLGVLLSSPWWIGQLLVFIWPALVRKEKGLLVIFGAAAVVLFAAGCAFGMWLAPRAVEIFSSFTPAESLMLLRADGYIQFYLRLVIAFGISFLVPEVLVMLNYGRLVKARTLLKGWRWATMICFIFAAIANPLPTPWPVLAQGLALLSLFFAAVGICAIHDYALTRSERKKLEKTDIVRKQNDVSA